MKDPKVYSEGLPPYELAFVADAPKAPTGLKTGEAAIDIAAKGPFDDAMLTAIGQDARDQFGINSEVGYEAAIINFRDSNCNEVGFGIYIANEHARDVMNTYAREEKGLTVDFYSGPVPSGGAVEAFSTDISSATASPSASATSSATASANLKET
jgi:hypothetical protein